MQNWPHKPGHRAVQGRQSVWCAKVAKKNKGSHFKEQDLYHEWSRPDSVGAACWAQGKRPTTREREGRGGGGEERERRGERSHIFTAFETRSLFIYLLTLGGENNSNCKTAARTWPSWLRTCATGSKSRTTRKSVWRRSRRYRLDSYLYATKPNPKSLVINSTRTKGLPWSRTTSSRWPVTSTCC